MFLAYSTQLVMVECEQDAIVSQFAGHLTTLDLKLCSSHKGQVVGLVARAISMGHFLKFGRSCIAFIGSRKLN